MDFKKMYPTNGYLIMQVLLLIFFLLPGIIFFLWRLFATK